MFCKNCGKESTDNQKFCTNCGNTLSTNTQSQPIKKEPVKRPPMPKEKWTVGRIIKAVIISAILLVVIVLKFGLGAINSVDNTAVSKNNNAISAYDSGNSGQAISQFQQASNDAVTNSTKVNTLKNLAYVYSSEEQTDLAISTFKQALALATQDSFDYYLIAGEIASLENMPNSALISYNKAYQLNPNDFQINNALALFYLDLGDTASQYADYKKGLQYAQRAVQLTDLQIAKQNLGIAYYLNEDFPKAISVFKSLTLDTNSYTAYWLGLSYARNQDPVNAKIYLRKAIANGVKVPQEVYDYLANN
jgi:tetratricopeptide (TPR) repeat protein